MERKRILLGRLSKKRETNRRRSQIFYKQNLAVLVDIRNAPLGGAVSVHSYSLSTF
jgi:hypothetical protein